MERKKNSINIRLGLYKSKVNKKGEHPLVIFIYSKGRRKVISSGFQLLPSEWNDKMRSVRIGVINKSEIEEVSNQKKMDLQKIVSKYNYLGKRLSLEELIHQYKKPRIENFIYPYFDLEIARLRRAEKIRNATVYKTAKNVMKSYCADERLTFQDVDFRFLDEMAIFLKARGVGQGSMSNYFRTIRALFNKAIRDDEIDRSVYPFLKFSVSQFKTETIPRTITKEEVHEVINYYLAEEENEKTKLAAEVFTFIYLTGGINFKDLTQLTFKQINGKKVSYFRSKTGRAYQLVLQPVAMNIIKKYKTANKIDADYIFPFLDREIHITPTQINDRSKKCLGQINKSLKIVGQELDISIPLTTYVARHSLASNLCNNGVSVKVIQNLLGHTRLETTNSYLKNFDAGEIDRHISHLL